GEPGVVNNLIGGVAPGDRNTVAFTGGYGIAVFGNPLSGSGQANIGNTIEGNSIFQNFAGIHLTNHFPFPFGDSVKSTPNDSMGHGAPSDPNNFQNFPVLNSVTPAGAGTEIQGTLTQSATPNTTFRIEFFSSNPDPQNGLPEGQFFLGSTNVTTNAGGNAS